MAKKNSDKTNAKTKKKNGKNGKNGSAGKNGKSSGRGNKNGNGQENHSTEPADRASAASALVVDHDTTFKDVLRELLARKREGEFHLRNGGVFKGLVQTVGSHLVQVVNVDGFSDRVMVVHASDIAGVKFRTEG